MSRDAVERRLAVHTATAASLAPTLAEKKISPHVLRHTAAMRLLATGVDSTVIALWLGHESVATTQIYIRADLTIKNKHSPEPHRWTSPPAATSPRTPSWPSSTACDYADLAARNTPPTRTPGSRSA